ncbi:MAG: NAD(P)-dependent oxidoreductase, partial [Crocinitomicaceae bacterium]
MIGPDQFAAMKPGAVIVSTARGGVLDEAALVAAMASGHLKGAALDVYENEPNPMPALLSHPRIACTPHIGAATLEAQDRIGEELADLIIEFAKNQ